MPRKRKAKEKKVYNVEVVTKARVSDELDWEYLVKWAGYNSSADSWEPSDNLQGCDRLLESFWKHVGMDNKDYSVGYEVAAKESWINKEKQYFAETYSNKPARKERHTSESSMSARTVNSSRSSDDELLVKTPVKNKATKRALVSSESEPESDGHSYMEAKARSKAAAPPPKDLFKVSTQAKQPVPSANGGSLSTPPLKATAGRTHQDQRSNPLVKSMDLPSGSVVAGSSLSTKQRVAARIPSSLTGPKPLPPAPNKYLQSLSFKKDKALVRAGGQVKDAVVSSASITTPASPIAQSTNIADDITASPQPMDVDQPVDFFSFTLDDPGSSRGSPEIATAAIPPKSQSQVEVDEFLTTVNIPLLRDPLELDTGVNQSDQLVAGLPKTLAIPKIPKKWRWSGDLFISTSENKKEFLCAISIADPNGVSSSSFINLLLSSLDSLWISRLYSTFDLSPLLQACGKPQFFGKLESNEPNEEDIIDGLGYHLINEKLVAVIPLLLDGSEAATLLVFPRAQQGLTKALQVPEHLLSGTPLVVVLLPFLIPTVMSTKAGGYRPIGTVQQSLSVPQKAPLGYPQEVMLHWAMSLLGFPESLLEFLNSSPTSRSYCIWPTPDPLTPGLDTTMLQHILKLTKAVLVKIEEDARVIFISNRHLGMPYIMAPLVTKLVNSPETQFWIYGYSANITCERWRVQEIYPLGGIVTFTSSALVEDVIGCHQLMAQITEHPLWGCYLIPEVLAVSHLLFNNGNPSSSSESCLGPILDLIDLGSISIIRMPGKSHSDQAAWLSQVITTSGASGHELLDTYVEALKSQHATLGMTAEQLISFTNNEITKDLSKAQTEPAFMENYRRFVVVKAASEDNIPFDKDGLEWTSLSQFSFRDDYFQP